MGDAEQNLEAEMARYFNSIVVSYPLDETGDGGLPRLGFVMKGPKRNSAVVVGSGKDFPNTLEDLSKQWQSGQAGALHVNMSKTVVRNFKVLFEGVLAVGGVLYTQHLGQVRVADLAG